MQETIATIGKLYIYPVKSMAGISVEEAHVGLDGILGDRQYSFVRSEQASRNSFPWMTAREFTRMLLYRPQFDHLPSPQEPEPLVQVRTPGGAVREAGDATLREELAGELGQAVFLLKSARGIFDCQHISLFSLASVNALAAEADCAIDPRQFRANVYMEPAFGQAFEEETWTDCVLGIGAEVLTGVTQRDARCMMINLNPESGEQNPGVLKAVVQKHQGQAGLYVNVIRPGVIRVGDPIRLVSRL
jgi:uncharacterized protein